MYKHFRKTDKNREKILINMLDVKYVTAILYGPNRDQEGSRIRWHDESYMDVTSEIHDLWMAIADG